MSSNASGDGPARSDNGQEPRAIANCSCTRPQSVEQWKSTHKSWQTFDEIRKKGLYFDVVLRTSGGELFPAHRLLLCTCSQYFRALFSGRWESGDKQEIPVPGIAREILHIILEFAYTRELRLANLNETKELLIVTSHLGCDEIVQRCVSFLLDILSIENCLDIWSFARTYYLHELREKSQAYVLRHFAKLVHQGDDCKLWHLCYENLRILLESDELNVPEERPLFFIALRWVSHDFGNRQKYMRRLMTCIRWGLVEQDLLLKIIEKNKLISTCPHSLSFMGEVVAAKSLNTAEPIETSTVPIYDENGNEVALQTDIEAKFAPSIFSHRFPRSLVLVVGGWCKDSPTNSTEAYEPRSRTWKITTPQFPQLLQRPRAYHGVVYLNGCVYVIGGFDGLTTFNACEQYDIKTNQWRRMCSMHTRRCYVGVTTLGGVIYAIGGSDGRVGETRLKSAEKFDPQANVWTQMPNMREQRSDAGVCAMGNKVYAAGGFTGRVCVFSVELYDVDANQWTGLAPMRVARSGVFMVPYRGKLVVLGGFDGSHRLRTAEIYHPDKRSWTTFPSMITKRSNFSACVVEGKLTVFGGYDDSSTCPNVEYFDDDVEQDDDSLHENFPNTPHQLNCTVEESDNTDHLQQFGMPFKLSTEYLTMGKWKPLPKMSLSRSALSSCVIDEISPVVLQSIVDPTRN